MGAGAEVSSGVCICDDGADLEAGASERSSIKKKEMFYNNQLGTREVTGREDMLEGLGLLETI